MELLFAQKTDIFSLFHTKEEFNDVSNFRLLESFISDYKEKNPTWSSFAYVIFKRTYARYIEKLDRTEEFSETLQRVVEGCFSTLKEYCMRKKISWNDEVAQQMAQRMFEKFWNFELLPSGRCLWAMGTDFVKDNGSMALCNCGFHSTENIDIELSKPFTFCMDALMVGVGIGFDTLGANKMLIKSPQNKKEYFIPDSRQGWIEALKVLLDAYFTGSDLPLFNYSLIRKKGERIKKFGGVSSGSEPLKAMLDSINDLLNSKIGSKLQSVDLVDIMNFIAKCVVAGNIRRSAEIALGDINDDPFIHAKEDLKAMQDHRWASNNSIVAKRGMDYSKIIPIFIKNGEPSIFWIENARDYSRMEEKPDFKDKDIKGVNPCGEQSLCSGELCNLIESFPLHHKDYAHFEETLFYAYFFAKIVTLIPTHLHETNQIMEKNRRLGISQSGIIDAMNKFGRSTIIEWCKKGYTYLKELDKVFSKILQINESVKMTTVKPSGTVSILAGVSSGIHYPHSKFYIRNVRFSENSDLVPMLRNSNYPIEKSLTCKTDLVIGFPIEQQYFNRDKFNVSIWEQVVNAVDYQRFWSDNAVSITVSFKPSEIEEIPNVLRYCEDKLKGITFLPLEHHYEQAPLQSINEKRFKELMNKIKPLALKSQEEGRGDLYCDNSKCTIHY